MRLEARDVSFGYDGREVSQHLDVAVPDGSFTVIIGPNACGKSTLLRGLTRLLKPGTGEVLLDGKSIHRSGAREIARTIGLLPQNTNAPEGITVAELVSRGRYPHQRLLRQWSNTDEQAVLLAMHATGVHELRTRPVDELSGGQRQRVLVAMALAQDTPILLLDEPTTFLDIAHQIELLDLFARLHRAGTTVVAVLHDLNHAARYADHLVVMKAGAIVATGRPSDVIDADLVEDVFGLPCIVVPDPVAGTPMVVPKGADYSS